MVTSSPHLSVAITCRGSDCSGSAVMGTLRTPGQAIFQVEATGAAAAAGCVSVCARTAGTHDEAMMLSKAKFTVIDLCTGAPPPGSDGKTLLRPYRNRRLGRSACP